MTIEPVTGGDMVNTLSQEPPKVDSITEFEPLGSAEAKEKADALGMITMFAGESELQVDIDSEEAYATYQANKSLVAKEWGIVAELETPSKSGLPCRHITLQLAGKVTDVERVALQAVLGSDVKRELFSLIRVKKGDPHPTLFFEISP